MRAETEQVLQEIGRQLDRNIFPRVKNGGVVMPSETAGPSSTMGVENSNDKTSRQRRPEAGSWKGTAGRQGSDHGCPWTAPSSAQISGEIQRRTSCGARAYPVPKSGREEGLWLLTGNLLPELQQASFFLTGIVRAKRYEVGVLEGWFVGAT